MRGVGRGYCSIDSITCRCSYALVFYFDSPFALVHEGCFHPSSNREAAACSDLAHIDGSLIYVYQIISLFVTVIQISF
jgi:hypothetical protein